MSDTLRNALNSLTVCDVNTNNEDLNTINGDVNNDDNNDFAWVNGGQDESYKESGLPLVSFVDENGHTLKLRDARGLLMSPNISTDVLHRMTSVTARPDDVLIATYPKCGTHWIWEIVSMLRAESDHLMASTMQNVDYLPLSMIEALPSPRVLSSHMPFSRVPRGFLEQGCKVVWCVRNPWDVAVSYFNFVKKLSVFGYPGLWSGFFELFLDGKVPYNSWFEHTAEWLKGMETTRNILMVRYEDLHNNFKREVHRIADHLDIPLSEQQLNKIKAETSFANMAAKKVDMTMALSTDGTSPVYRKGKSGDWINWFTERQSAELNGAYRVAIGLHNRRLQYSRGKAANGMPA